MGFVDPARPDIFISYARVDDDLMPGAEAGWVSSLVRAFEIVLARRLGRREAFDLWMDHRLPGNAALTAAIRDKVRDSALLIILLSPGYLASEWCQSELTWFLDEEVGRRRQADSRIFVVECDRVERPPPLAGLLGTRFWVQKPLTNHTRCLGFPCPDPEDPEDRPYYDRLNDLAFEVAEELKEQAGRVRPSGTNTPASARTPAPAAAGPPGPTVYLAEVTDDLEERRDEVRRYLLQMGLRVLPEREYAGDSASLAQMIRADLSGASLFVQLLSEFPGKKLAATGETIVGLRDRCARETQVPVMQWRSPGSAPANVAGADHRALLERQTIIVADIEEFKALVVQRVRELTASVHTHSRVGQSNGSLVLVNAEATDVALAEEVCDLLAGHGVWAVEPRRKGEPDEIRLALEHDLVTCDGLVLVYGSNTKWLDEQIVRLRKLYPDREKPIRAMGLYDGPPPQKEACRFRIPGMTLIGRRDGVVRAEDFHSFLQSLGGVSDVDNRRARHPDLPVPRPQAVPARGVGHLFRP